ncbi:MAG: enoyl-CoA hydratase/isomerase family protein [Betaproteobacteria bacterium]|jgi:enoyl-CoA hydratase|nr:enoyl-CoA hydratase/isomerase family protein [Betaproteobacteria bacterium]
MSDLLRTYERGVLRVTLNRPERRNALTRSMLRELRLVFEAHAEQDDLRLAILTGTGSVAFSSGGELDDLAALESAEQAEAFAREGLAALDAIRGFPVPTVAALNGVTLGEGAELALACDMRVAAQDAWFGFVHANLHLSTTFGGGTDLLRLLGRARGLELLASARRLSADEALALGIVNRVAAVESDFLEDVERFVAPMFEHQPHVLRALKALALADRRGASVAELREYEIASFLETSTHEAHRALLEKLQAERG